MDVVALKPGVRLSSASCSTQVVVVRPPSTPGVVECGGEPMVPVDGATPSAPATPGGGGEGTLLGKRYEDADTGLELLCTQGGGGSLSIDGRPLQLKGSKPLPSSD